MALSNPTLQTRSKWATANLVQVVLILLTGVTAALAEEPPLDVPKPGRLTKPSDVIAVEGWLLYPTLRLSTQYSDNLFMSTTNPISVWGFGLSPALTAEWTNGIHKTTLYGNIDRQIFPTDNEINTFDYKAGFTQRYEALRDLVFTANGDYSHKTISQGLQSSIPSPVSAPATIVLSNGNTQLPDGTILSPTGERVGQAPPAVQVNPSLNNTGRNSIVNPYDVATATVSVEKYLNRGIVGFSGSIARTIYELQGTADTTAESFSGHGAFALGPIFYVYSNGTASQTTTDATGASSTSFRAIGGIGARPNKFVGASGYYGRQGSESGTGTAGGEVFGASLAYNPTPDWTLNFSFDETVNIASQGFTSNLALSTPNPSPVQVSTSQSTRVTGTTFSANYLISPQWTASGSFGNTRIEYIGSPRLDNSYYATGSLMYLMSRSTTLTWEYQFSSIDSNAPGTSTWKNLVSMSLLYKF